MIVDTSFVLDVIDGVDSALEKERELETEGVPLVIPTMTVLELYIGAEKSRTRQPNGGVSRPCWTPIRSCR